MKIVITGTHSGIGRATALEFIAQGHEVHGIDMQRSSISEKIMNGRYTHHINNVKDFFSLPIIDDVDILINNAGTQDDDAIYVNLIGLINCTEMYGLQPNIKSILNLASVSAHNGAEFPNYVASKGGVLAYTKWTAKEVAKYGATCNSLSFGGVITDLNSHIIDDNTLWMDVMEQTPLKKWCTVEECADWIYFMTVVNKSCTSQDIIIDNGEMYNHKFIW